MSVSEIAYSLLEAKPLCDNCFGRQFALLGHGLTNQERGKAIKLFLTFEGHRLVSEGDTKGFTILKTLANNGLARHWCKSNAQAYPYHRHSLFPL